MSKSFFRFLRGELNGYYLLNMQATWNSSVQRIRDVLLEFKAQQFEKGKISDETLYNLGKFAGIFLPRIPKNEAISSIRLTESEYDEDLHYEFSERGLLRTENETFEFEHKVIDTTGLPDINTLATDAKRSSLVGEENVLGYISSESTDVLDDYGKVRPEKIQATPPADVAYSDYYGNKFLFLSEMETAYTPVSYGVYFDLFKAMQWIRYNGVSVQSLAEVVKIICPSGLVTINSITTSVDGNRWVVDYSTDLTVDLELKSDRISMFLYIMRIKFPQVEMTENI